MPGTDTSSGGARRRRRRRLHRALSFENKSHSDRRDANGGRATLTDGETTTEPFTGQAARLQFPAEPRRTAVPAAYSSLPSSPAPRTPDLVHASEPALRHAQPLFSLWDYLREELLASDLDSQLDLKWERVSNFLSVPLKIEKTVLFGFILCLDAFLHTFTILPIRFTIATYQLLVNTITFSSTALPPSQKADIFRALLVILPLALFLPNIDISKIYHSIRGQDTIKLYVIFNALEIADRLFTSFGEDLMDCLFSVSTLQQLSRKSPFNAHKLRPFVYFSLTAMCTGFHALMLVYQLTSLNVAINSFDQSLLTLLVSNQFVEIKGSVFKKFEKDNLFQITCADIVERFQLSLMLLVIAFRIMVELSGTEFDGSILPKSFGWVHTSNVTWTIIFPVMTVLLSEIFVDWLKHAFITKFNHIRPSVYERYIDILCRDLSVGSVWNRSTRKPTMIDQAPFVTRRLGLAALPLAIVAVLVSSQALEGALKSGDGHHPEWSLSSIIQWAFLLAMMWFCLIFLKVFLGIQLFLFANRRSQKVKEREALDSMNDYGRPPVGEAPDERNRFNAIKQILSQPSDNLPGHKDGRKTRLKLEEVTRFTMTKKIW